MTTSAPYFKTPFSAKFCLLIFLFFGILFNSSFVLPSKSIRANNYKSYVNAAPVFTKSSYSFYMSEQASVGNSTGQVTATDADGNPLIYSIRSGNTNKAFSINSMTGLLSEAKLLNHHTQSSYSLVVRVTDNSGLFDEASVKITVNAAAVFPAFSNITWGTAASQLYSTHEVHGDVVNNKLYIFGGYDVVKHAKNPPQWTPTKRSSVYNPATNKWDTIADLPHTPKGAGFGGITHDGLTTDGTDIYFAGGYPSNANGTGQVFGTKQVWRYNVATNTYTALPDLPIPLATGQLRYLQGKLHYMGGANLARKDTSLHYALDLDNLSAGWKVLAPVLNGTNHPGSAVFEGRIYYMGGSHFQDAAAVPQKTLEVYDPNTNAWTKLADMPVARDHISSSVIVVGDRILVLGGETSHNGKSALVSAYTPATNTWTELTPLPVTKAAGVAGFINNNIYYTGGNFTTTNYKGTPVTQGGSTTLAPLADAYVRNGTYANNNYGSDSILVVKSASTSGFNRFSYLKFSLSNVSGISAAKLRVYGSNTVDNTTGNVSVYGVSSDTWTESGITWNNAPPASTGIINSVNINGTAAYYEVDVTSFVKTQFSGDKTVSFLLKDAANTAKYIQLNSKENNQNRPQLLISTSSANTPLVSNTADLSKEILSSSLSKTRVYPNPVLNKLNIELSNNYKGFVYVKIVDPEGRIYDLGKMKPTPGAALLEIDISRMSLSKGIYFLHLNTEAKEAEIIKFVIQ